MTSLMQAFLLLVLITFVLAAPAPTPAPVIQKRSFKVDRVRNPNFRRSTNHVRAPGAGTRAMIKASRKFRFDLPAALVDAMNANSAGSDAAVSDKTVTGVVDSLISESNVESEGSRKKKGTGMKAHGAGATKTVTAAATNTPTAPGASSTAFSNGTGTVVNTPEKGDTEYLSPVTIGGQTINMDFDSGSSDLWVFNSQLAAASTKGHTIFDLSKSTSFNMISGATYSISYGDGSNSIGNVGTDNVEIGGVTVTSQAVELPTSVSSSFVQDSQSNGLVGLAFSKLNTVKPDQQKTFFDNAMPNLAEPVFTADLRAGASGSYEFGKIDSSKFSGSLSWTEVNTTNGFWQFSSGKFAVGNGAAKAIQGGQAIADTGTTLMLVDPAVVTAYYSQVNGAVNDESLGGVTFPCSNTLPDLAVDVGGNYMAVVRGDDINFAPVDAAGTTCYGGVQAISNSLQIYGDIMFKSQFVVFNGGNNSIGMAPHQ